MVQLTIDIDDSEEHWEAVMREIEALSRDLDEIERAPAVGALRSPAPSGEPALANHTLADGCPSARETSRLAGAGVLCESRRLQRVIDRRRRRLQRRHSLLRALLAKRTQPRRVLTYGPSPGHWLNEPGLSAADVSPSYARRRVRERQRRL